VKVFVEGGGRGSPSNDLRLGLQNGLFGPLRKLGVQNGVSLEFVACKARPDAIRDFKKAVLRDHDQYYSLLLVDSEGPVDLEPWDHLRQQEGTVKTGNDSQLHLMVQAMEAWFVADPDALLTHFGPQASITNLMNRADVEVIPKDELVPLLNSVAAKTPKAKYQKSRDHQPLLELIDPKKLLEKSNHFRRLYQELERLVNQV
jgi:hypothetical protein